MFIGSDNQFRNLYVMKTYKASESALEAVGDATLKVDKVDTAKNAMYLVYKDTEDNLTSDIIDLKNLLYVKSTKAADMARKLNSQSVTLNEDPISGQDYVLNVEVRNFVALGDDSTHIKFGAVHAVKGMTKSDFYKAMALNLAKNLSREVSPILNVLLTKNDTTDGESEVPVLVNGKMQVLAELKATESYTDIIIDEVEQPWRRGVAQVEPVNFNTTCGTVLVDGDDVIWGTVEKEEGDPVNNGKQIADMEWFYHGTRGDIYREATYPDNFDFKPLVDETKAYSTLDIHFAYVGPGVEVAKSERTITVVCADAAELNKLITAIKTATGVDAGAVS